MWSIEESGPRYESHEPAVPMHVHTVSPCPGDHASCVHGVVPEDGADDAMACVWVDRRTTVSGGRTWACRRVLGYTTS